MLRWKGKIAVVTGASSGIGAAISKKLVESGMKVVGLARRKEKIEELVKHSGNSNGQLFAIATDITKEEQILETFKWIRENLGPVHVLVNNAGILRVTNLIDGKTKFWKEILDTNVLGLCMATREAVKDMRKNKVDGHIVHINSIVGHSVANIPNLSLYIGSKYAVTALTETLRHELNSIGSKIRITSVSPGYVDTDIFDAASRASGISQVGINLEGYPKLHPSDIADAVSYVIGTPPNVQIHELIIKPVGEVY